MKCYYAVSGPEELKDVIKENHIFASPNMSEDDFKGCILRVCKRLKGFMQHFSAVQRGMNPKKILESVFHCTEMMLYWSSQYPGKLIKLRKCIWAFMILVFTTDVAEYLLSTENVESASKAAETYRDSRSINSSFKNIRQRRDSKYTACIKMMECLGFSVTL